MDAMVSKIACIVKLTNKNPNLRSKVFFSITAHTEPEGFILSTQDYVI